MSHFDTGASITNIDVRLAEHLSLTPIDNIIQGTANGEKELTKYAIDLSFPNTHLKSFLNLEIGSCQLAHFNLQKALDNPMDMKNFGVLIGRDIMSNWLIVWNGTQSIININD